MENKTLIVYHENCMDGIASAFIAKSVLGANCRTVPVQYGDEQVLFGRHETKGLISEFMPTKDDAVYFVDFSLKRDLMIELASRVKEIVVLDHHKTAEANLKGLEEELDNVTIIFDMDKSGATLCYDYFEPSLDGKIFDYIADRDLWRWKLDWSKEISSALRFYVKQNDLESFEEVYNKFLVMSKAKSLKEWQELEDGNKLHDNTKYIFLVLDVKIDIKDISEEIHKYHLIVVYENENQYNIVKNKIDSVFKTISKDELEKLIKQYDAVVKYKD